MACLLDKSVGVYRPRKPLESDFHRLVREHFEDFRTVYGQRYARKFGHWRPVFGKAVRRFLKCGGTMKIIAFIEVRQDQAIGKILEHCGIWEDPPSRGPPGPGLGLRSVRPMPDAEDGIRYEIDPDFLEYARRAATCGDISGGIPAGEQAELLRKA